MSIIDKLLVLFDDEKKRTIDDVKKVYPEYTKQVISASLGRIASKNWISKQSGKYLITKKGRSIVTDFLSNIDRIENQKELNHCLFVIFHIPEKERINRDIMRNYLSSHGFGRLHNTVWIKFNENAKTLKKLIKELNIEKLVLTFTSKLSKDKSQEIIDFTKWNSKRLRNKYKSFIKESDIFLSQKNKKDIQARCLVYELAKALCEDPIVPNDSNTELRTQAYKNYKKVRTYC